MKNQLDKIKLIQLHALCNTIVTSEVRNISNIKRKYSDIALSFDDTLLLLEELGIVINKFGELSLTKPFSVVYSIDDFKQKILPIFLSTRGYILDQLRKFFINFQTESDKIYFKATEIEKIKFSNIRNILLELDFILVSEDNTTYFVNNNYANYFYQLFSSKKLTPELFRKQQLEKDSVGLNAEKTIIAFEIKRLSNITYKVSEIQHTALVNVNAGYDINSFENYLDSNSNRINRYIEVKAVSIEDYKFFWNRHEMEIAKVFGPMYYLYLLPAISDNEFLLKDMQIIRNPYKELILYNNGWLKTVECLSLKK